MRDTRESSYHYGRTLRLGKVSGRKEMGQMETGGKTMSAKETGGKENGAQETVAKEAGGK